MGVVGLVTTCGKRHLELAICPRGKTKANWFPSLQLTQLQIPNPDAHCGLFSKKSVVNLLNAPVGKVISEILSKFVIKGSNGSALSDIGFKKQPYFDEKYHRYLQSDKKLWGAIK